MYITDDGIDPATKFEDLARFAFDCRKREDPWGYAGQDVFNQTFVRQVNIEGMRILSTILIALILKYKNSKIVENFIEIEDSIWSVSEQKDVNQIVMRTIRLLESMDV